VAKTVRRNVRKFGPILFGVLALLLLFGGVFKVDPGEVGVVRRFGREHRNAEPGLHFRVPVMETVDVVNVEQIRRIEVGFRAGQRVSEEALMLTGDENIVEAQMIVQYRVADPSKYLFRLRDPEGALLAATQVALRSTVLEDLYLVLGSYDDKTGLMTLIVFVNPLVNWLWLGGIVMVLGTVIVMSPTAAEQRALAAALAVEERGLEAALR